MDDDKLARIRTKYDGDNARRIYDAGFSHVASHTFDEAGTRVAPFAGLPTLLDAPYRAIDWSAPDLTGVDVALIGVPMDLGVTNRNGSRFGPRAIRAMERVGPYNHALKTMPSADLGVFDLGDVPFRSRFDLTTCHEDIEQTARAVVAKTTPLFVGGDHSISLPILRAMGAQGPVGMVHIDAHCDTAGPFDGQKFHHGGPFRQAVLDGVLDPERTIQIGIRGASEYIWEFSTDTGMTVLHAEEIDTLGIPAVIEKARAVVGERPTYVSFDIDSLDPAFAPGTGTPEVGGLSTREAMALVRGLAGIKMIGGDVVEVAPQYDATTNTAHAGAQMLFELLSVLALSPR